MPRRRIAWAARGLLAVAGVACASYAAYAVTAWLRYGHAPDVATEDADPLLDRFMPVYDVVERHHIRIAAPPDVTLEAATRIDLRQSPLARAIFRAREIVMGSRPVAESGVDGLLAQTSAMGWGRLAEVPGREIVMGAVTQPWMADVVFRPLAPDAFAAFDEPGYVKIVWTLRADPERDDGSVFRTQTRAVATDAGSRAKFRRYWSMASPGIIVIRWMLLGPLKATAELLAREGTVSPLVVLTPGTRPS